MSLTELFDASLRGRADRAAIEYVDSRGVLRALTFGDVEARANRMAHELTDRGVKAGDRLCVHLANSVEFIDLFLACTRLGVIFVPMNVLYRERELRHMIGDASPRAVVVDDLSTAEYPENVARWTIGALMHSAATRPSDRLEREIANSDPALIIYTSGTTGTAKGAVLAHGNVVANAENVVSEWRIDPNDRFLCVLPLFHVHGLANGICGWLASGCTMHLAERFDQHTIGALFDSFKPTLFFGVPTMYVRLLDGEVVSDDLARRTGSAMRLFVSGSAPLPSHVHAAFERRFAHAILERYGMSEALMIAGNLYDGERRAGTVGRPFPGVELRIAAIQSGVGEVQIKSPALFSKYWQRDDATDAAFVDGWFRTGDMGVQSDDGYLTLHGRSGDLIISGGFNIYPREIEDLLLEDSRVREAAVVGVADDVRGQVPIAYVVADESVPVDDLTARCRQHLASFKTPRAFIRVDALPRNALGKVMKQNLPDWVPT